jgi:hypothetical protein
MRRALMLQAPLLGGLALDPFAFDEDGLPASEVDSGRCEIAEALVVPSMIVALDDGGDLPFETAGNHAAFRPKIHSHQLSRCPEPAVSDLVAVGPFRMLIG